MMAVQHLNSISRNSALTHLSVSSLKKPRKFHGYWAESANQSQSASLITVNVTEEWYNFLRTYCNPGILRLANQWMSGMCVCVYFGFLLMGRVHKEVTHQDEPESYKQLRYCIQYPCVIFRGSLQFTEVRQMTERWACQSHLAAIWASSAVFTGIWLGETKLKTLWQRDRRGDS